MLRSTAKLLIRLTGLAIITLIGACVFAAWYITRNPIDLEWARPRLEQAIEKALPSYDVQLGSAVLSFDFSAASAELVVDQIWFHSRISEDVTTLPRLELTLATGALLRGQLKPSRVKLTGQALELRRDTPDSLSLSLFPQRQDKRLYTEIPLGGERAGDRTGRADAHPAENAARQLLRSLANLKSRHAILGQLKRVELLLEDLKVADSVSQTALAASDLQLRADIQGRTASISLSASAFSSQTSHLSAGLAGYSPRAEVVFSRHEAKTHFASDLAYGQQLISVKGEGDILQDGTANLRLDFDPIHVASLATLHPAAQRLSNIALPVEGAVTLDFDTALQLHRVSFDLAAGPGQFALAPFYLQPLAVQSARAEGVFDPKNQRLRVNQGSYVYPLRGGETGQATGRVYFDFLANEGLAIEQQLEVTADRIDTGTLLQLWPQCNKQDCLRTWFENAGINGNLRELSFTQQQFVPKDANQPPGVVVRHGKAKFDNLTMQLLPSMPYIQNARGSLALGLQETRITLEPGMISGPARWGAGQVGIEHKEGQPPGFTVSGSLASRLQPLLATLGQGRIGLEVINTLPLAAIDGNVQGEMALAFRLPPPGQAFNPAQLDFKGQGKTQDLAWLKVFGDTSLTRGTIDFSINKQALTGRGQAWLDGAPTDLEFARSFEPSSRKRNVVELTTQMPVEQVLGYLPFMRTYVPAGNLAMHARYDDSWQGLGALEVTANLEGARVELPFLAIEKAIGAKGQIQLLASLNQGRPTRFDAVNLDLFRRGAAQPFFAAKGKGVFSEATGAWQAIRFDELRFEQTLLRDLVMENQSNAINIAVGSGQFDARAVFDALKRAEGKSASVTPQDQRPIVFHVNHLDTVLLPSGYILSDLSFYGERLGTLWQRLDVAATLPFATLQRGGQAANPARVTLSFAPLVDRPLYELYVETSDAGALLKTLGYWKDLAGGSMRLKAHTQGPLLTAPIVGEMAMQEFFIRNAPVVSDLFNFASLQGIEDLLNNQGLYMDGLIAEMRFDRGLLDLKTVQLAGPSVGINLMGQVDLTAQRVSLAGTVAPFNFVAQAVEGIPLIGQLLTGTRGEGLLAAEFTVAGPYSNLVVSVNPFTALAPGILRELFNELTGNISPHEYRP